MQIIVTSSYEIHHFVILRLISKLTNNRFNVPTDACKRKHRYELFRRNKIVAKAGRRVATGKAKVITTCFEDWLVNYNCGVIINYAQSD